MPTDLRKITDFDDLRDYLEDELDWNLEGYSFEDLTFEYEPEELGLKNPDAAKVRAIHQLRPLSGKQPWGIFFVEFESKKLPVVVMRRILSSLVLKKRASANKAERAAFAAEDLLFITRFGTKAEPEIAFAHFHQENERTLPVLRVLGWDGQDTPLKLERVATILRDRLTWPAKDSDHGAWREQWAGAFRHRIGHVIHSSDLLATELAVLAKRIRDAASDIMGRETEKGPLTKLHLAFKEGLIHDLTPEDFADTYAQTITYGLFTAAISRTVPGEGKYGTYLSTIHAADLVPDTSPFLKEMLSTFLEVGGNKGGLDFDELGIQNIVDLFTGEETDMDAILRDFGNKTRGEDPVMHFYEHFLTAYNKQLRAQRGVFYTPQPVVSYIVRSVHELLQTEFGLEDGLADTATWGEMLKRNKDLKLPPLTDKPGEKKTISPNEPFVQILDPATGTATFLVEVIEVIHKHLTAKWTKQKYSESQRHKAWNEYVPEHLLPRLHAYELMMAPYAIAHMKIGLKLKETGYDFSSKERVRIYLTNALEPWMKQLPLIGFEALAHEAAAVNEIKRHKRFTVVIGNPPYARDSANRSGYAESLVAIYKEDVRDERNIQPLSDDYVKFLGMAQAAISSCGIGFVGFITNHSFLRGLIHRGLRKQVCQIFQRAHFLDLHGNSNINEQPPNGIEDKNVFDIKQGVAVSLLSRMSVATCQGNDIKVAELWGSRSEKYDYLLNHRLGDTSWSLVEPKPPEYGLFVSGDGSIQAEFDSLFHLQDWFPTSATGFITHRDELVIDIDRANLLQRVADLNNAHLSDAELRTKYALKDNRDWQLSSARKQLKVVGDLSARMVRCTYRPFDSRWCWWGRELMDFPRPELFGFFSKPNLTLLCKRQNKKTPFSYAFVTSEITESCTFESAHANNVAFPVFVPTADLLSGKNAVRPNVGERVGREIRTQLGLDLVSDERGDLKTNYGPRDLLNYVYAILHAPSFRERFEPCLIKSFPRLPLTGNLELFRALARLGSELIALHLLEAKALDKPRSRFIGKNKEVSKVIYTADSGGTVWIDGKGTAKKPQAGTSGFTPIPPAVWNFHIGGYQVCEKWLKDRKGRTLTDDDIAHYHKIVIALTETIRLMKEIDEVIDTHGGWPGAFQGAESEKS